MLLQALVDAKELGDSWLQNQCLVYLTILFRLQGNSAGVETHLSQLVEISQQVGNSMYIGVSQANTAWLHYRAGEWQQALIQAEAAIASWVDTMYPFQWLAYWPLLATALWFDRPADAIAAARAMLDSEQQQLPDEVNEVLDLAVAAWEAGDEAPARLHLERAAELAAQHGYL